MSRKLAGVQLKHTGVHSPSLQQGMSLVELMVGLVVGLILLGGVIQTLLVSKEASSSRQSMAAITENARFIFEFMGRDLRMAGRNFTAVASRPLEYKSGVLTAFYTVPVSSSVEQSITVTYEHDNANNTILYSRVVNPEVTGAAGNISKQVLIDGISDLDFNFGRVMVAPDPAASTAGEIRYFDDSSVGSWSDSDWESVISLRAELTLEDPAGEANDIQLDQDTIMQTFTLRNRVLKIYQP